MCVSVCAFVRARACVNFVVVPSAACRDRALNCFKMRLPGRRERMRARKRESEREGERE